MSDPSPHAPPPPQAIQIAVGLKPTTDNTYMVLYALMDDGTIWRHQEWDDVWFQVTPPPLSETQPTT